MVGMSPRFMFELHFSSVNVQTTRTCRTNTEEGNKAVESVHSICHGCQRFLGRPFSNVIFKSWRRECQSAVGDQQQQKLNPHGRLFICARRNQTNPFDATHCITPRRNTTSPHHPHPTTHVTEPMLYLLPTTHYPRHKLHMMCVSCGVGTHVWLRKPRCTMRQAGRASTRCSSPGLLSVPPQRWRQLAQQTWFAVQRRAARGRRRG
jgi:hypothetical protein